MTKYFVNYWSAKKLAEKRGLRECEYGDCYGSKVSYCLWNKSGSRDDEPDIECYYLFEKQADGFYKPEKRASSWLKDWVKHNIGVEV